MSAMLSPDELLGRAPKVQKKPVLVVRSPLQPAKTPKLLLSAARVNRMRSLVLIGLPKKDVARIEEVSRAALGDIIQGHTYRNIAGPRDEEIMAAAKYLAHYRIVRRAAR